jgi:hypothetical protein
VEVCIGGFTDYSKGVSVGIGEWTWIVAPFWDTDNGLMVDVNDGALITVKFVRPN